MNTYKEVRGESMLSSPLHQASTETERSMTGFSIWGENDGYDNIKKSSETTFETVINEDADGAPVARSATNYKVNTSPHIGLDGTHVGVERRARNAKTGKVEDGAVDYLTGKRAEKAERILTRRMARMIGDTATKTALDRINAYEASRNKAA